MPNQRVVITGMGTVNPLGTNVADSWAALLAGKSGVSVIDRFDVSGFTTRIAAMVKEFDPSPHCDHKEIRRTSRFVLMAIVAAKEAVADSGLDVESNPDAIGVEIGSGMGGLEIFEQAFETLRDKGPSKVSPFTVPMMIPDMAAGQVAIKLGAKGPNSCSVTACASSANSIGNAYKLIRDGDAVAMITGGSEAVVTPIGLASFCAARSLSTQNDSPETASRPFDAKRDGFVMGEGAGILVLEELEHAKKRGAKIYAELVGFGSSGDAYHITAPAPEGEGAVRAMKMALRSAGIKPEDVDYINAHGTSTELNDKNESIGIRTVFGEHAYKLNISSTKSMTGHLLGAAGALEAIVSALTIQDSIIAPTINYEFPDPNCDLNYTSNTAVKRSVRYVMSNSFGFGGHNSVLIFKRYEDR